MDEIKEIEDKIASISPSSACARAEIARLEAKKQELLDNLKQD